MSETMLERLKEHLSDKEFLDSSTEFFSKKMKLREIRYDQLENYINVNNFDTLILRLMNEHNSDYREECYSNGFEPYPNNKLELLLEYVSLHGDNLDHLPKIDCEFPNDIFEFRGYYFQHIYGQGTITRIYNKDDFKLILQL